MGEISSNNNSDACIIILRNRYKHDKQKFTDLMYWNTKTTVEPLLIQIRRLPLTGVMSYFTYFVKAIIMYLNVSMELESTTSPYTWVIIYSTALIILAREMEQIKNRY